MPDDDVTDLTDDLVPSLDDEAPTEAPTDDGDGEPDIDPDSDPDASGAGDGDERAALVQRAQAMGVATPLPPPRRTGVFVDVPSLREHVGALLRSMLGGYEVDALGNMTFTADAARIFVTVGPGPLGPQVGVFSITNVGIDLTPDLAGFLLTTNHRMAFGAFSYEPEQRAVWLRHSLLGGTLDGPELRGAVISIASTAAKVATLLRDRFGAGAFEDASDEVQAAVHPPETDPHDVGVSVTGYL